MDRRESRKDISRICGGPDTLLWIIEDHYHDQLDFVKLSRSTIYRILVRRRLLGRNRGDDGLTQKQRRRLKHSHKYIKGYPGEEIQVDTTELFGNGKLHISILIITLYLPN